MVRPSELAGLILAALAFTLVIGALLAGSWWLLAAGVAAGLLSLRIRW